MSCSALTEDVLKTLSTQFLNPASQTCICFSLFCVFFLYRAFLLSFCLSQVQTVCVIENMHEKHVETHRLTSFSRIRQTFSHTNILLMHTYTNSRFLHNVRADGDSMPVYSWLGRTQDQVFMLPFWSCVVCIWRCSFSSAGSSLHETELCETFSREHNVTTWTAEPSCFINELLNAEDELNRQAHRETMAAYRCVCRK